MGVHPAYRHMAEDLGTTLARRAIRLVYGGGRIGLMGVVADAALAAGGEVVGVIPDFLLRAEVAHDRLSEQLVVSDMQARKKTMFDRADGAIVLPGGLGTLDEAVEILTWNHLRIASWPLVFLDVQGYWQPFFNLLEHMIEQGFVNPSNRRLWPMAETPEAALALLARQA
jgi:uncharacterized protein (TIGR00730 family)